MWRLHALHRKTLAAISRGSVRGCRQSSISAESPLEHVATIDKRDGTLRLDRALRRWLVRRDPTAETASMSQPLIQRLLRKRAISISGASNTNDVTILSANTRLGPGTSIWIRKSWLEQVAIRARPPRSNRVPVQHGQQDNQLPGCIVFMNDDIIVLNKPTGLAVQGGPTVATEASLDGALPQLMFGQPEPPKLVHRLDQQASGILLLARHTRAAQALASQFKAHRNIAKTYSLFLAGPTGIADRVSAAPHPAHNATGGLGLIAGLVDRSLDRTCNDRTLIQTARSRFVVHAESPVGSWVSMSPITGRRHQLRRHAAASVGNLTTLEGTNLAGDGDASRRLVQVQGLGSPVFGDRKYGQAALDGHVLRDLYRQGDNAPTTTAQTVLELARDTTTSPPLHLHAASIRIRLPWWDSAQDTVSRSSSLQQLERRVGVSVGATSTARVYGTQGVLSANSSTAVEDGKGVGRQTVLWHIDAMGSLTVQAPHPLHFRRTFGAWQALGMEGDTAALQQWLAGEGMDEVGLGSESLPFPELVV